MKTTILTSFFYLLFFLISQPIISQLDTGMQLVHFKTEDSAHIEAVFFNAKSGKVVIFAHGAIFNKESWYFLAKKFQKKNVAALSIDFRAYVNNHSGNSSQKFYDILGAIEYVKQKGFKKIYIIAGSMGASAVLTALNKKTDPAIAKVILLSPAGGVPIQSNKIQKLFIVSKGEGLYKRVKNIYSDSSKPKELKEFPGNYHAQHMFKAEYAPDLIRLIIDFVILPKC